MTDLQSSFDNTRQQVRALEKRADDVHQAAQKLNAAAQARAESIHQGQLQAQQRCSQFEQQVAQVQAVVDEQRAQFEQAFRQHLVELDNQTRAFQAHHEANSARLDALRAQMAQALSQLTSLQQQTHKQLGDIRNQTQEVTRVTLKTIQDCEHTLSTVARKTVQAVAASIQNHANAWQRQVEQQLGPQMLSDVGKYSQRIGAVSSRLSKSLELSHQQTETHAQARIQDFHTASQTDWKGGAGDVTGAASQRSSQFAASGSTAAAAVAREAQALHAMAGDFDQMATTFKQQYGQVHSVPVQIKSILGRIL